MLKREVREMVKYLISERKSFKVVFANDVVEVVKYRGYCWVMNGKAYSDEELVEKMVRFQNNEKKFIIKFEEIEEVVEEVAVEEVEEVENLNDDLFQESDIAYAEEAIERETHKKENDNMKTNIDKIITNLLSLDNNETNFIENANVYFNFQELIKELTKVKYNIRWCSNLDCCCQPEYTIRRVLKDKGLIDFLNKFCDENIYNAILDLLNGKGD